MSGQFLEGCKTRKAALNAMPRASRIVKVCGGYTGFEYELDYLLFVEKPQKRHKVNHKKYRELAEYYTKGD